jgi:hypothetical protein
MLGILDVLIRDTLVAEIPTLAAAQIVFQPPDEDLRQLASGTTAPLVDVYLVELRENRKLRSNERRPVVQSGLVYTETAPERIDCHYLISVWRLPRRGAGVPVEPEITVEHPLLYEISAALLRRVPLNPSRLYPAGSARLTAWPLPFQDHDLPTNVLPAEGYPRLGDFWHAMGSRSRWRPIVHLIVTLPVARVAEFAGTPVTTMRTDHRLRDAVTAGDVLVQIGGTALRAVAGVDRPLAGAWIDLETPAGIVLARARSDADGHFTFDWLREGFYQLRAQAEGLVSPPPRQIRVPNPSGEYDIRFP